MKAVELQSTRRINDLDPIPARMSVSNASEMRSRPWGVRNIDLIDLSRTCGQVQCFTWTFDDQYGKHNFDSVVRCNYNAAVNELRIVFRWIPVECSGGQPYCYPQTLSKLLKAENAKPGIYRWAIYDGQGTLKEAYIGETENVQNRLYQYLHPGKKQQTNIRLKAHLDRIAAPNRIAFEVLRFDPFRINECEFSANSLTNPHTRSFLEGLVIADTLRSGCKILNAGKDSREKQIEEAIEMIPNLSAEQRNELVRRCVDNIQG